MKKLSVIILLFCIIPWLFSSGATLKDNCQVKDFKSLSEITSDTTGLNNLIRVDSFDLAVLSPSSGVQFYGDKVVFLSMTKYEEKMLPDYISFGTIEAYSAMPEDSIPGKHTLFSPWSSFPYPCEAITFSSDLKTMYFTRLSEKDNKEKIYKAKYTLNDKNQIGWLSEMTPLSFCSNYFSYSHPALSADEQILIFASDASGSLGGMDLFITRKEGDKWSAPLNMGNFINTAGNEFFPFLDSDNNLFFSSDGLKGYGGFDIYTCKFNGKDWDKPVNLSDLINSPDDDIAFTINKSDGKSAFFTRRQKSDLGEMQLFRITLNKEVTDSKLSTLSQIFNGKSLVKYNLLTTKAVAVRNSHKDEHLKVASKPEASKEVAANETPKYKRSGRNKRKGNAVVTRVPVPIISERIIGLENNLPSKLIHPVKNKSSISPVIYRVQIASSTTSKGKYRITVNNKGYDTYEYFYLKAYRYTIGEYTTLASAVEFQNTLRNSGYPMAFVVVFKNNVRSLDPTLLK